MTGVEFNDRDINSKSEFRARDGKDGKRPGFLVRLVMKLGLAKDESAANSVLLIVAIIIFAISLYFWF